jgi:hypothetical protein
MPGGLTSAFVAVGGVLVLAVLLRRFSGGGVEVTPAPFPAEPPGREDEDEDPAGDEDGNDGEAIAVTSDGRHFVPMGRHVQLMAAEEGVGGVLAHGEETAGGAPAERFAPGDFTGARVGRGAGGFGPWRLEVLGPEGEYIPFPFETEEAARAALAMLERRGVVRAPRDEDGVARPPSPEQFEEARRRYDETEHELATWADEPLEDDER